MRQNRRTRANSLSHIQTGDDRTLTLCARGLALRG